LILDFKFKILGLLLLIPFFIICCNSLKKNNYKVISYLDIKVDKEGHLPTNPYIISLNNNNKSLIVIGIIHSFDTMSPVLLKIEEIFYKFRPDVIINEGGVLTKHYKFRNEAITKNGELGLEKYLADKSGIQTINGDISDSIEFIELSKKYSEDEALLFFASERFIIPYKYREEKENIDSLYKEDFIKGYLESCGIKINDSKASFQYYKSSYKKYMKKDFALNTINSDDFSPIKNTSHFCEIARTSKEMRDQNLLQVIENQVKFNNKVFVVFGGWHILAIEPALKEIIKQN